MSGQNVTIPDVKIKDFTPLCKIVTVKKVGGLGWLGWVRLG